MAMQVDFYRAIMYIQIQIFYNMNVFSLVMSPYSIEFACLLPRLPWLDHAFVRDFKNSAKPPLNINVKVTK